jgi:transcriptional regulator with XRE-family HTH domain
MASSNINLALKFAIMRAGREQRDVAAAVGLHESQLSLIINGHRQASVDVRQRLAAELRVPERDLFPEEIAS